MSKFQNYEGRKLRIVPKRDWGSGGWWDSHTASTRRGGFIVTDGACNVIPGAGWFHTVRQALIGIQCLQRSGSSDEFHLLYREAVAGIEPEPWGRAMVYAGPYLGLLDPATPRTITRAEVERLEGPHRLAHLASLPFVTFEGPYSDSPSVTTVGARHPGAYGDRNWNARLAENLTQARGVKDFDLRQDEEVASRGDEFTGADFDALLMH